MAAASESTPCFVPFAAAALAAAAAALDVLFFPPGTYRIASSVTLGKPIFVGEWGGSSRA